MRLMIKTGGCWGVLLLRTIVFSGRRRRRLWGFGGATVHTRPLSSSPIVGLDRLVESQVGVVSTEEGHRLQGVAKELGRMIKEAEDIRGLAKEGEKDPELQKMARSDLDLLEGQIEELSRVFLYDLVDMKRMDPMYQNCQEILLEVSAGVGGQEAMLFSRELLEMYRNYVEFKRWGSTLISQDLTELGGLRHGSLLISSEEAFRMLSLESGVHRVQRVPVTEKGGRIHTSTSAVSILPTVDDVNVKIDEKDLKIETKKASGAGGQHVNTTESAVRISHLPTGLTVECQTERSQIRNRTTALKMLMNKLHHLEYEKNLRLSKDLKKMQIGLGERSDKIRTYNYPQGRVTDHRYSYSVHNIESILEGGDALDSFLNELKAKEVERVLSLL